MTKEELEKEAYRWTEKNISVGISMYNPNIVMYCSKAYKDGAEPRENKIADIKANCDLAIEGRDVKIKELKQQIEKMKRHCNCKHRDSEGYCEVKRTYLMDLSYDGCDKWELED